MKRNVLFIIPFLFITLFACSPRGRFLQSSNYEDTKRLDTVYLLVIGSKETSQCFDYLEDYLKDSLTSYAASVGSKYYCCRDRNTDVTQVINGMVPSKMLPNHILAVVITKDIIGYGTTSSRELAVNLLDTREKKVSWSGKLRVNFDWFISDENYKNVARKINQLIITELIKKGIVSRPDAVH